MPKLLEKLDLERCPHCKVDRPNLQNLYAFPTNSFSGDNERHWRIYECSRCGGVVIAASKEPDGDVTEIYPASAKIDESLPSKARVYLSQALNSLHAPAGAAMLAGSAVDAMLKEKGYKEGSLYNRIDKAAEDHLITEDMAQWAHKVRLDVYDRHNEDTDAPLPEEKDALKCVDFAQALAEFLFVLPSRITRGLEEKGKKKR